MKKMKVENALYEREECVRGRRRAKKRCLLSKRSLIGRISVRDTARVGPGSREAAITVPARRRWNKVGPSRPISHEIYLRTKSSDHRGP